jgi:hypothetical protein
MQGPVQPAVSQHTPSTQLPEAQVAAEAAVQPSPLASFVTVYSQVSLVGPPGEVFKFPPNTTATRRVLSNAMAERKRLPGVVSSERTYQVIEPASSSQVCRIPLTVASV